MAAQPSFITAVSLRPVAASAPRLRCSSTSRTRRAHGRARFVASATGGGRTSSTAARARGDHDAEGGVNNFDGEVNSGYDDSHAEREEGAERSGLSYIKGALDVGEPEEPHPGLDQYATFGREQNQGRRGIDSAAGIGNTQRNPRVSSIHGQSGMVRSGHPGGRQQTQQPQHKGKRPQWTPHRLEIGADLTGKVLNILRKAKGDGEGSASIRVDEDATDVPDDEFEKPTSRSKKKSLVRSSHSEATIAQFEDDDGSEDRDDETEEDHIASTPRTSAPTAARHQIEAIAPDIWSDQPASRTAPFANVDSALVTEDESDVGEFDQAEFVDESQFSTSTDVLGGEDEECEDNEILNVDDSVDDGFFSRYRSSKRGTLLSSSAGDLTIEDSLPFVSSDEDRFDNYTASTTPTVNENRSDDLQNSDYCPENDSSSSASMIDKILNVLHSGNGAPLKRGKSNSKKDSGRSHGSRSPRASRREVYRSDIRERGSRVTSKPRYPQATPGPSSSVRSNGGQDILNNRRENSTIGSSGSTAAHASRGNKGAEDGLSGTLKNRNESAGGFTDALASVSDDVFIGGVEKQWVDDTEHRREIFNFAVQNSVNNSVNTQSSALSKFAHIARKGVSEKSGTDFVSDVTLSEGDNDYNREVPGWRSEEAAPNELQNTQVSVRNSGGVEPVDGTGEGVYTKKTTARSSNSRAHSRSLENVDWATATAARLLGINRIKSKARVGGKKDTLLQPGNPRQADEDDRQQGQAKVSGDGEYDEDSAMPWSSRDEQNGTLISTDSGLATRGDGRRVPSMSSARRVRSEIARRTLERPQQWNPMTVDDIMHLQSDSTPIGGGFPKVDSVSVNDCITCRGSGLRDCPICEGEGWIDRPPMNPAEYSLLPYNIRSIWERPDLVIDQKGCAQCPPCNGLGKAFCADCEGSGSRTRKGFDIRERDRVFGLHPLGNDDDEEEEDIWNEAEDEDDSDAFSGDSDADNGDSYGSDEHLEDDLFSEEDDDKGYGYGVYEGGTGDIDLFDLRYGDPDEDDDDEDEDEDVDDDEDDVDAVGQFVADGARGIAPDDSVIVDDDESLLDVESIADGNMAHISDDDRVIGTPVVDDADLDDDVAGDDEYEDELD